MHFYIYQNISKQYYKISLTRHKNKQFSMKIILIWGVIMPINQTETNLHAITVTIAYLEKQEGADQELLKRLKEERTNLLKKLRVLE